MNHTLTAAHCAGARETCAEKNYAVFPQIMRRDLLRAIRTTRRHLGLSTGDVLVLDALLSFLPCRDRLTKADRPIDERTMLVIYASNAAICERANGMDERVLRRHIARLAGAGLLTRRDSATCKRFPLRVRGRLVSAYGIDLTPLLCRHTEIRRVAEEIKSAAEEARALRAEALALRADVLRVAGRISGDLREWAILTKTVLRRATLQPSDIRAIIDRMAAIIDLVHSAPEVSPAEEIAPEARRLPVSKAPAPAAESIDTSEDQSAGNGLIVRQVESQKIDTKNHRTKTPVELSDVWRHCNSLAEFYPTPPRSTTELKTVVYEMGSFIGLGERPLAEAITTIGWLRVLKALDYLVENAARIREPARYLSKMIRDFMAGNPIAGLP